MKPYLSHKEIGIMGMYVVAVAHVHWALRAPLAKETLTTVKTTTVRTEQPASMESTTTLVFVPPTTQVSLYNTAGSINNCIDCRESCTNRHNIL